MNNLLERLGGFAARRHWIVIIAWLVILGGTLWARHASGGEFVNNYSMSGSGSALGQDLLNKDFPQDDPGALHHGPAGRAGLVDAALAGADRPAPATRGQHHACRTGTRRTGQDQDSGGRVNPTRHRTGASPPPAGRTLRALM
jgi:hypothetical protein